MVHTAHTSAKAGDPANLLLLTKRPVKHAVSRGIAPTTLTYNAYHQNLTVSSWPTCHLSTEFPLSSFA